MNPFKHSDYDLPENPTITEMLDVLDQLPDSTEYEWELVVTDIVERLEDCRTLCEQILEQDQFDAATDDQDIRFAALFILCTYLRRQSHYSEARRQLKTYSEFSDRPMYSHIRSMVSDNYQDQVRHAHDAAENAEPHPGASHNLARNIIDGLEEDKSIPIQNPESVADTHLNIALNNANYPKHRATKGLLLALRGEFEHSKEQIRKARDMEDEDMENYAVRLAEYQEYLFRVRMQEYESSIQSDIDESYENLSESIDTMETKANRLEDYFDDVRTQSLQFIGFFATLLAVIITSAQFATQVAARSAAPLIVIMIGGLMTAIGGFNFTLPKQSNEDEQAYREYVPMVIGILILALGLGLLYLTAPPSG